MDSLKKALLYLENAGIRTNEIERIERDIESQFASEVILISNKQFKVYFDKKTKELNFETAFSNQKITDEYINTLLEIKEMVPLLEEIMIHVFENRQIA